MDPAAPVVLPRWFRSTTSLLFSRLEAIEDLLRERKGEGAKPPTINLRDLLELPAANQFKWNRDDDPFTPSPARMATASSSSSTPSSSPTATARTRPTASAVLISPTASCAPTSSCPAPAATIRTRTASSPTSTATATSGTSTSPTSAPVATARIRTTSSQACSLTATSATATSAPAVLMGPWFALPSVGRWLSPRLLISSAPAALTDVAAVDPVPVWLTTANIHAALAQVEKMLSKFQPNHR
mmetsp:Transcript_58677/g.188699  ORF Transcript_58677/g.188699 Transcript_58677/m.188699 type:complete len:243 (+) Transcript_58677:40-768(+)